jgi:ribosomal protein S18 acetylase RimI-like enzyme
MHPKFDIQFVQAQNEDIEFLLNLRMETMSGHFRNSKLTHTVEDMRKRVLYRFDCAKIIVINGERAGLLKVIKEEKLWELCQIQITRKYQRQGIGNLIISNIIREAGQEGLPLKLDVLKSNPAKRLYERLGFVVTEEDVHSYEMFHLQKGE